MKKVLSLFLALVAIFVFVGCGEKESGGNLDFTVNESINKEVFITEKGQNAIKDVFKEFGVEGEEAEQTTLMIVEYAKFARLDDAEVLKIVNAIEKNMETILAVMSGEVTYNNSDVIYSFVQLIQDVLNAIDNDTIGLLLYNIYESGMIDEILSEELNGMELPEMSLEFLVVQSRFMMHTYKAIINSISKKDVETVYNLVEKYMMYASNDDSFETEPEVVLPTAKEVVALVDIIEDAVKSINISDAEWAQYYKVVGEGQAELMDAMMKMLSSINGGAVAGDQMAIIQNMMDFAKETTALTAKFSPAALRFLENTLEAVTEKSLKDVLVVLDYDYECDQETYECKEYYYINGKEVSEEESEKAEIAQIQGVINIVYNGYKALSQADKDAIFGYVEAYLEMADELFVETYEKEYGEKPAKYEGEKASREDLFKLLDAFLACETYDETDDLEEEAMQTLMGYLGEKAPYLAMNMFHSEAPYPEMIE